MLNLSRRPDLIPNWRTDERVTRAVESFKAFTDAVEPAKVLAADLHAAEVRLIEAEVAAEYGTGTTAALTEARRAVEQIKAAQDADHGRVRRNEARRAAARKVATEQINAVRRESADQWCQRARRVADKLGPLVRQVLTLVEEQRVLDEIHSDQFGDGSLSALRDGVGTYVMPAAFYATPGQPTPPSFRKCGALADEAETHLREYLRLVEKDRA